MRACTQNIHAHRHIKHTCTTLGSIICQSHLKCYYLLMANKSHCHRSRSTLLLSPLLRCTSFSFVYYSLYFFLSLLNLNIAVYDTVVIYFHGNKILINLLMVWWFVFLITLSLFKLISEIHKHGMFWNLDLKETSNYVMAMNHFIILNIWKIEQPRQEDNEENSNGEAW